MSVDNFIPTVWSMQLRQELDKVLVYGRPEIINRKYEGEFRFGGTVKISHVQAPTVKDYTKNTDHDGPEVLDDGQLEMSITQRKYFNIYFDDVDRAQTNLKEGIFVEGMRKGAEALADVSDQFIAGMYTDIDAGNQIGSDVSPISLTAANVYQQLVDIRTALADNKVSRSTPAFVIVPPWFHGLLQLDNRFVQVGTQRSDGALTEGIILRGAGLTIYESLNVPAPGGNYKIIAGHQGAWSYADQIPPNKMKAFEPERRFGDAIKTLHMYGAKVVEPTEMVLVTAVDGS